MPAVKASMAPGGNIFDIMLIDISLCIAGSLEIT